MEMRVIMVMIIMYINGNNNEIGLYSAGCQVHQDYKRFTYEFMPIIKSAIGKSSITYTLINEDDL